MTRRRLLVAGSVCAAAIVAAAVGLSSVRSSRAQQQSGGPHGFSHRVYSLIDGKQVLTMSEGPEGEQVRCQSEDLPCSYLRLKALYQSGASVPADLHMTREEIGTLVGQLDRVAAHLQRYKSGITQACADGYRTRSAQVANMGFHMAKSAYMSDNRFDPEQPEILLFAVEGADQMTQKDIGDCVDGRWTGDPRQQIVGAAFVLPTQQFGTTHPDGFAGPLDNWHIHYNVCLGTLAATSLSKEDCARRGGGFLPDTGWMLHVYAVPEFDNPLGVFSVWNPSIFPKTDARTLAANLHNMMGPDMVGHDAGGGHAGHEMGEHANHEGAAAMRESVIFEFKFEDVEIAAGESVVFRNGDHAFHTVTAGTPSAPSDAFDSGRLNLDQTFTTKFDRAGVYPFYCRIHPKMTARVVVK
jgi:plastocyanin